jgi:hypothetical protein
LTPSSPNWSKSLQTWTRYYYISVSSILVRIKNISSYIRHPT